MGFLKFLCHTSMFIFIIQYDVYHKTDISVVTGICELLYYTIDNAQFLPVFVTYRYFCSSVPPIRRWISSRSSYTTILSVSWRSTTASVVSIFSPLWTCSLNASIQYFTSANRPAVALSSRCRSCSSSICWL